MEDFLGTLFIIGVITIVVLAVRKRIRSIKDEEPDAEVAKEQYDEVIVEDETLPENL